MSSQTPSFSIILETENLAVSDLKHLKSCLQSLKDQTLSIEQANEFILVDSGLLDNGLLQKTCQPYGKITIVRRSSEQDYFMTKMSGVGYTTGNILVFVDCDCTYEKNWLQNIISPFQDTKIQVVTGETYHQIHNPYELAVALTWVLEPFSNEDGLRPVRGYFANGVAFRRETLLKYPLQSSHDYLRTGQTEHAAKLLENNIQIWRQPKAKAYHEVPTLQTVFPRMFKAGQDVHLISSLNINPLGTKGLWAKRFTRIFKKTELTIRNAPITILYLPFAIPLMAIFISTYLLGYFTSIKNNAQ